MNKMKKLKILKPTMRENKRYLLLETSNRKKIEKSIFDFIGQLGWARSSPQFVDDKSAEKSRNTILAINHNYLDEVRTASELSNIHCLGVSGTIKKLKDKLSDQTTH